MATCRTAPVRKAIPRSPASGEMERCSSPAWVHCPLAAAHVPPSADLPRCPCLDESLVQYCSAAPVTRFVPYNDGALSRCNTEAHRYCEVFLAQVRPSPARDAAARAAALDAPAAGAIVVPDRLAFAPNHMWLDVAEDRTAQVGIDALLARALGSVERVQYVSRLGFERPAALFTVRGVDLVLGFPRRLEITAVNTRLRADPEGLIADPYGAGWLFEGAERTGDASPAAPLLRGAEARAWMRGEALRLAQFVRDRARPPAAPGETRAAAGGEVARAAAEVLDGEGLADLFRWFFGG